LVGKMPGPWRGGQVPIESQLVKKGIEIGMFSGGSDTIPGHVPVQGTRLKSYRRYGHLSRSAKKRLSIFCRLLEHLYLRYPKMRGQSHRSILVV